MIHGDSATSTYIRICTDYAGSDGVNLQKGDYRYITVSLPPWTCSAASRLPSGGSTGSVICSSWGPTGGSGWRLRGGGPAPRHIPAPRSPAWWNGRGGGSRMAGSAGRLSACWPEGCSAAGWPPNSRWKRGILFVSMNMCSKLSINQSDFICIALFIQGFGIQSALHGKKAKMK